MGQGLQPGQLNFEVIARPSRIDGTGAFAAQDIPPHRKIGHLAGERISVRTARERARRMQRVAMVEIDDHHALDATRSEHPLRYVNHACRPNAFMRIASGLVEIYSLRAIAAGEELTLAYGQTHHEGRLRCTCGLRGCTRFL